MTPKQIAAIKGMLSYFDSGNNIPVDKAVIKGNCAEVAALRAALAESAPVQEQEPAKKLWLPHGVFPDVADFDADGLPRFYSKESVTKFQGGQCSKPCTGKNCGSMNGWMHSIECRAEHEAVNTAPVQETSTCGRCVVFCQGGDGCLSGMSQITQIERERLVCGQLSRRTPPADVPMLTEILHAIDDAAVLADFAECWIKDPSIEGMHRLKNGGVKFRLLAQAARQKAGLP